MNNSVIDATLRQTSGATNGKVGIKKRFTLLTCDREKCIRMKYEEGDLKISVSNNSYTQRRIFGDSSYGILAAGATKKDQIVKLVQISSKREMAKKVIIDGNVRDFGVTEVDVVRCRDCGGVYCISGTIEGD